MGHLAKYRGRDYRRLKSTALGDWKASRAPIPKGEAHLPQNDRVEQLAANPLTTPQDAIASLL